jgi:adenylate cyclase, class 2
VDALENDGRCQEIEVKYRVSDVDALVRALESREVELSSSLRQDDQAYAPAGWAYGMSRIGVPFARLRTQGTRHVFTVKKPVDNVLACIEYESEVTDRGQMHEALLVMGWVPTVRIAKQRRTGRWGAVSVCLDEVEELGAFIELERMAAPAEPGEQVQTELDALVRSLGVEVERTHDTYDSLLRSLPAAAR